MSGRRRSSEESLPTCPLLALPSGALPKRATPLSRSPPTAPRQSTSGRTRRHRRSPCPSLLAGRRYRRSPSTALRRINGAILWDQEYAAQSKGFSCTGAPLVVKDKVIVGVASSGQTCFVAALSAETGKEVWRVWAVPRKGEPGADTWGDFPLSSGGGPTWTTGS